MGATEPRWVRVLLIFIAAIFIGLMVGLPLAVVFGEAFSSGWKVYFSTFTNPYNWAAIELSLWVAGIAVPCNLVFGVAAAWALTKFRVRGEQFILSMTNLPFTISPVVVGLIYVLMLGSHSPMGHWLEEHGIQIIYNVPGLVLVTMFVTMPFVLGELAPLMRSQGTEEEETALLFGANGWQIFTRVTLPNIKWGLLYGVLLCTARALGEFGAVSVVSGHIEGKTNTIPLQVEALYDEYHFAHAFALASVLTLLAVGTLAIRRVVERKAKSMMR